MFLWGGGIRQTVYVFHVPLFFFLSALFIKTESSFTDMVRTKFLTIMLPYYLMSMISILIYYFLGTTVAEILGRNLDEYSNTGIAINLYGMFFASTRNGLMQWNMPLWFLPCLFAGTIVVVFIEKKFVCGSLVKRIITMVLFALMGWFTARFYPEIYFPFQFESMINMAVWMEAALLLKGILLDKENIEYIRTRKEFLVLIVLCLVFAVFVAFHNGTVEIRINRYGNYFLYLVDAVLYIFAILGISIYMTGSCLMKLIGKNTMSILLLHKFPILFFQSIFPLTKTALKDCYSIYGIICSFIVAGISIFACIICSKIYHNIRKSIQVKRMEKC